MVLYPRLRRGRNPACYLEDALVILKQGSRKDRLVMGDPIPQLPQSVRRPKGDDLHPIRPHRRSESRRP
ncbi:MAG: hypothetical protein OXG12_02475, partial [Cyanobacteria bacterium MAG COS4_bin_21]|nr:hypothetical protein [Cyanobacteria bacterium MAG COS4_bin_21]